MNKSRRIGAVVATATAAAGMATVTTAAPAAAVERGPQPVSTWLTAVRANTASWINIYWRSGRTVCDTQVRVNGGRRVAVAYPADRPWTSFPRGGTLRGGRSDHTAIQVAPDFDRSGIAQLRATIEYTDCGWHARTESRAFVLNLPVIRDARPRPGVPGTGPVVLPGGPTPGFPGGPVILPGGPGTPGGPVILPGGPGTPGGPVILPGAPGGPVVPPGPPVAPVGDSGGPGGADAGEPI